MFPLVLERCEKVALGLFALEKGAFALERSVLTLELKKARMLTQKRCAPGAWISSSFLSFCKEGGSCGGGIGGDGVPKPEVTAHSGKGGYQQGVLVAVRVMAMGKRGVSRRAHPKETSHKLVRRYRYR